MQYREAINRCKGILTEQQYNTCLYFINPKKALDILQEELKDRKDGKGGVLKTWRMCDPHLNWFLDICDLDLKELKRSIKYAQGACNEGCETIYQYMYSGWIV